MLGKECEFYEEDTSMCIISEIVVNGELIECDDSMNKKAAAHEK